MPPRSRASPLADSGQLHRTRRGGRGTSSICLGTRLPSRAGARSGRAGSDRSSRSHSWSTLPTVLSGSWAVHIPTSREQGRSPYSSSSTPATSAVFFLSASLEGVQQCLP